MSERLHVVPVDDLKPHAEGGEYCACAPAVQTLQNGDRMVVHNAYDGREFYEVDPELVAEFGAYHAALIGSPDPPK